MKLRFAIVAACLLAGLVAGCTYVLDTAGRATPPVSSGLAITRPERPAATPVAEATICPLTPTGATPCPPDDEGAPAYPAPEGVAQVAVATAYPGPTGPADLPPATVVMPTMTSFPAEPTDAPLLDATPSATPAAGATATALPAATATPAATSAPRTPAPTPSDPLDRAMLAAVRVQSPAGDGADVSAWRLEGMGVVVDGDTIVAPLHVLYDAASGQLYDLDGAVAVEAFDAAGYPIAWTRAVLTAWDAGLDLAVLTARSDIWAPPEPAGLGATDEAALPMQAPLRIVLLAEDGERATRVLQTEVSGRYEDDSGPWIVAASNMSSGAIGGGVALNAAGQVVGLVQPEGGLAPGQLMRIRPIDAVQPLLAADAAVEPLPETLPVAGDESSLRILYRGAEGVNLRSSPSTSGRVLASLHRDEVYPIVSPGEVDGWFPVYAGGGRAGWVAQRHPTGTRLAEVVTAPYQSALTEGGVAEVACLSAAPGRGCANLRATPGWRNKPQDDVVAELAAGQRVQIIGGPQQADGLAWWQVRDPQGALEGWIAEVTAGGYRALIAGAHTQ